MKLLPGILFVAALASGANAQVPIFQDDFDSQTLGLNRAPVNWQVDGGTVDIIGESLSGDRFYDFLPGNGIYIDLDGTSQNAGRLFHTRLLQTGVPYRINFELAGNQRDAGSLDVVTVTLDNQSQTFQLGWNQPFTSFEMVVTPVSPQLHTLSFENTGGDNIGALLDRVSITLIPEPSTYALMLAGLGIFGFNASRRR